MALARLHGGPLDGQIIPLEDDSIDESLVMPYGIGQIVYKRQGALQDTGPSDGPTRAEYWYVEATEEINPSDD